MTETRNRILTATAELFRLQGYNGTSLKQVTTAAAAPTGSLYHFFPGGKEQLAETVIVTSGEAYRELFEMVYASATSPAAAITDFFNGAAEVLEESDYLDPCPIGSVALEVASTNDRLRRATHDVFASWVDTAATRLEADGIPRAHAEELAVALVAAVEGGFMLSRAARSAEPMRTTGQLIRRLVEIALRTATAARAGSPD
ncbi:MAG TPA: TetR/AcrR family transcriptional regulator [Acidimicrobiales bacterium]|nr:TetR/AcrR family transcriptional regulator [Acidimicrobiales bacterium]